MAYRISEGLGKIPNEETGQIMVLAEAVIYYIPSCWKPYNETRRATVLVEAAIYYIPPTLDTVRGFYNRLVEWFEELCIPKMHHLSSIQALWYVGEGTDTVPR